MSIPGSASPLFFQTAAGAAAAAGPIKSARFNSSESAYLNRTQLSAGNRKTWTASFWVKVCKNSGYIYLMNCENTNRFYLLYQNGNLTLFNTSGVYLRTAAQIKDTTAWTHHVIAYDSTQSTSTDRVHWYINGVETTDWVSGVNTYPSQNAQTEWNTATAHEIGSRNGGSFGGVDYFLTDFYFIDGSQKDATDFGAFDDSGVWQAAAYSGTFGTNGFHLFDFANESGIGDDSSGNDNDFTPNNLSTGSGSGNDVLFDAPTNGTQSDTGAGGELSGNYATLNPLNLGNATLSNGNLECSINASGGKWGAASTIGVTSGKFYIEVKCVNAVHGNTQIGVGDREHIEKSYDTEQVGTAGQAVYYRSNEGNKRVYTNGSSSDSSYGNTYTQNDIIGIALNADDQEVTFYKNGTAQNSGTAISIPTTSQAIFLSLAEGGSSGPDFECNFGQRAYTYSAPSGYKALCTTNLPTPTIADGSVYFEPKLFTGTGASNALTMSNSSLSPDWVWIKERSTSGNHELFDAVRGANKVLESDSTNSESTVANTLTSFDSNGFTLGTSSLVNDNNVTYVAWSWDAGSSTVSNTDGTITSSVRANATAGFSIITYTGNGSANQTIGHGLNDKPSLVIIKSRDNSRNWVVIPAFINDGHFFYLNDTSDLVTSLGVYYGTHTSSVVGITGSSSGSNSNASGEDYLCLAFAPVAGYSAFGTYIGNGSLTDGPYIHLGFRPAFFLLKSTTNGTYNWHVIDSNRSPFNPVDDVLRPNLNSSEVADYGGIKAIFCANGIKLNANWLNVNNDGETFFYYAVAENPFQANGGLAR